MQAQVYKSESRGTADYGWLKANYSFSFANYYNPERIHFGALRVLNDDVIAPSGGFDTHPHDNMEIITIPLSGRLAHKDSMGHTSYIEKGEIQVMSAGKGIFHSEFNGSDKEALNLFQIWLFPKVRNVEPRYQQIALKTLEKKNELYQILSPDKDDEGVWIYQDAWFHMGQFDNPWQGSYQTKKEGNGIYLMVIEGEVNVAGQQLTKRDAMAISDASEIEIEALANTQFLIMDIPMNY
ncbi:pirin family protein [Carboxylicivirga mesophila]|uniref:Pirin family protein n=1 Tax=Carboxylicivirga mesophila TaxID=1166478 RepID=A0ABS5K6S0_9BACT|nr:pirin family protein [Carboxylicivirga mesophila]MBS2210063.1 pirin family protein [Carboxylicivirga mesophila]